MNNAKANAKIITVLGSDLAVLKDARWKYFQMKRYSDMGLKETMLIKYSDYIETMRLMRSYTFNFKSLI